jgi:hypothetical protein
MSKNSVSCTITNMTGGYLTLAAQNPNKGTDLDVAADANSIGPGVRCPNAFTGSNSAFSGCGGTVTYTLPNNTDILVIAYNTSTTWDTTYCFPMLQSANPGETLGCDEYWCTAASSYNTTSDGTVVMIAVYES